MLTHTLPTRPPAEAEPLWPLVVFLAGVTLFWHDTLVAQLVQSPELTPQHGAPELAAWGGILAQATFSALEAFLPGVSHASGALQAKVDVGGAWTHPELAGGITITNGKWALAK